MRYRLALITSIVQYANQARVSNWFRRRFQLRRSPGGTSTKCAACGKVEAAAGYVEPDSQRTISHLPYGTIRRLTTQFVQSGWTIPNFLLALPR
jgi:hypothetical protein